MSLGEAQWASSGSVEPGSGTSGLKKTAPQVEELCDTGRSTSDPIKGKQVQILRLFNLLGGAPSTQERTMSVRAQLTYSSSVNDPGTMSGNPDEVVGINGDAMGTYLSAAARRLTRSIDWHLDDALGRGKMILLCPVRLGE